MEHALSSRACEIAGVHELELDLEERDPDFVQWSRVFIKNLKQIKEILPFRRSWVPQDHHLLGFLVYTDGGKIGLGSAIYALSSKENESIEKALCIANGRLSKRNIVEHEVLAELLGAEDLYRLLQPLLLTMGTRPCTSTLSRTHYVAWR